MVFVGLNKKRAPHWSLPTKDNFVNSSCNSEDKKVTSRKGRNTERTTDLLTIRQCLAVLAEEYSYTFS
jgi:hypothetical protein